MACMQLDRSGHLPSAGLLVRESPAGAASSSQAIRLWRPLRVLLVSALQAFEFAPSSSGQERGFQLGRNANTAAILSGVRTIYDVAVWFMPP